VQKSEMSVALAAAKSSCFNHIWAICCQDDCQLPCSVREVPSQNRLQARSSVCSHVEMLQSGIAATSCSRSKRTKKLSEGFFIEKHYRMTRTANKKSFSEREFQAYDRDWHPSKRDYLGGIGDKGDFCAYRKLHGACTHSCVFASVRHISSLFVGIAVTPAVNQAQNNRCRYPF
jgi:hypothetical protein